MTWWRRRTLRVRLLLIGVVGLSLGLLAGGLALVAALGVVLQRSVDAEVTRTASDVAELVDRNRLPQPVPVAGADLVQVVDDHGRVLSSSLDADRLVPMLHPDELASARTGRPLFVDGDRLGLSGPIRVVAMPAGPPGDPQTVLVGRSMADVLKGMHLLRSVLLVLFPLLVLILALVFWRAINAALRPVESLRRGAEEITGASRSGRLPVPVGSDEIHLLAVTLNGMLDRLEAARTRQRPAPAQGLRAVTAHEALRRGRTCYDHLAGRLGVAVTDALTRAELVDQSGGFAVTPAGLSWLTDTLGVPSESLRNGRRPLARGCLDWTERRPHLAGVAGAKLCETFLGNRWVTRVGSGRAVLLTPAGRTALRDLIGLSTLD